MAIDGPVAAGKSTVGERVAHRLDAVFFDTGVLYRALTLLALRSRTTPDDAAALAKLAATMDVSITPPTRLDGRQSDVLLAGEDVTWQLRTPEVDRAVSAVSAHAAVRDALLETQRRIGRLGNVVMVGRDIGTVVMPDAELKVFLDASAAERARRRCEQLAEAGKPADYDQILADLIRRDEVDTGRDVAPLRAAPDAFVIDTDPLSIGEVVERIVAEARRRMASTWTIHD